MTDHDLRTAVHVLAAFAVAALLIYAPIAIQTLRKRRKDPK